MTTLVTGAAGFIGFSTIARLLARGDEVIGIDNLNDYYSVQLKRDRVTALEQINSRQCRFIEVDFADHQMLEAGARRHLAIDRIVHLGAQAGRPLFDRKSPRLCPGQPRRPRQLAGTGPSPAGRPSRLCIVVVGIRQQRYAAFPGRGSGRPSGLALCRDQARRRADERKLCPSLSPAADGPSLLHRLRPLGPSRHGDVAVCRCDLRRATDQGVQPAAICAATSPISTTSSAASSPASTIRHPMTGREKPAVADRHTASTISATIARKS